MYMCICFGIVYIPIKAYKYLAYYKSIIEGIYEIKYMLTLHNIKSSILPNHIYIK